MDRVSISDLRVETRVGVTKEERAQPRTVVICCDIWTDLLRAGSSDELGDTVDYHSVIVEVADLVRSTEAKLLEHLAERIAALITALHGVRAVTVEVTKESPPMAEDVRAVSVTIERPAG
jgi:FolB domain-containing protein